ncbi:MULTISPECIES: hypothetical protein [Pseudoalteromonas]|uniref:Uncharacterized protein n=1 Tax=Pseudoalteromonas piscicida TaxID=43662 RepID=A0ABM6NEX3_PSEO7|nr:MULTISPECIES: hypothetical protein [Pseudoalteromonas]ATD07257.1 hypothetical protein PPIS_a2264 [Pseudoalteromonas piscicida]MCO7197845.1 hypothetical protein [Pseudoalteromonas sp. OANN1]MDP4487922.1 hypothetical protein [Pseudoalteromonas piscicida]WPU33906.1 hypothetical protein SIO17_09425 [Pseudoalteromonas piscicida]
MDIQIHQGGLPPLKQQTELKSQGSAQVASNQLKTKSPSDAEEKPEVPAMLSKELDDEAAGYKEDNPVFKEDYENLEKAMDLIQAQIRKLQERINKLMQSQEQRFLKVEQHPDATNDEQQALIEHVGSKKYRDQTKVDEVEVLEEQLSEFKQQEAELRIQMLKMILAERERLEELKRKGKR